MDALLIATGFTGALTLVWLVRLVGAFFRPSPSVSASVAPDTARTEAITLVCRGLWEAADADSATGGPDALRGIYPIVATITGDGWSRVDDAELATLFQSIADEVRAR